MRIPIDTLALIHKEIKVANVYVILVESCNRFLRLLEKKIVAFLDQHLEDEEIKNVPRCEAFHFFPEQCGHFVTRVFIKNANDNILGK